MLVDIAEWAITGILSLIAGLLWAQVRRMRDHAAMENKRWEREHDALRRGMQMQLRAELIAMHDEWIVDKGYMPLDRKQLFHDMFCAYEQLGENGIISSLYADVRKAHVAPNLDDDTRERD